MTREEIRDCVAKWKSALWLGHWNIDIVYKRFENLDVYAEVVYQPQYMTATIYFPYEEIVRVEEKHVLHEMIHIAISPLAYIAETTHAHNDSEATFARYQKELLTTHLTNVFYDIVHPQKLPEAACEQVS